MCGRYRIEDTLRQVLLDLGFEAKRLPVGEIYPTNAAPLLTTRGLQPAVWGFPKWDQKGVIINACAETVQQKKLFQPALEQGRCVVPTSGFYEWDAQKQKTLFELPDEPGLLLAGLLRVYQGVPHYVILTTAANESVAPVHNRMPVVLRAQEWQDWVQDRAKAYRLLHRTPPALISYPA